MICLTPRSSLCTLLLFTGILSILATPRVAPLPPVPLREPPPRDLRVYSFTARITNDGGVTPFRVGATITGTFTYDLKGVDNLTDLDWCGHLVSPRNAFAFQFGDECFSGTGPIWTTLSVTKRHEHVGVVAHDLRVPKGWEIE